jgi:putative NADPH-quinone reductase
MTRICIIQGHPHAGGTHFCHALAEAYKESALAHRHEVHTIDIATLNFKLMLDPADMATIPTGDMHTAQMKVKMADHLVIIYPLWLGTMPALVKGFFEQLARGEFLIAQQKDGWPATQLKGRSARVVVTMGMSAAAYSLLYGAHGVRGFENMILGMAGIGPIKETLIGPVGISEKSRKAWLAKMRGWGAKAA